MFSERSHILYRQFQSVDSPTREGQARENFQLDAFFAYKFGIGHPGHHCRLAKARARSAYTHACGCASTQWAPVKVLPSLSNNSTVPVYPPRVLRLRAGFLLYLPRSPPSRLHHCLAQAVAYTNIQRANIDKSVGAKTSEG